MPISDDKGTRAKTYGAGHVRRQDILSGALDAHHCSKISNQEIGIPFVIVFQTVAGTANKDVSIPFGIKLLVIDIVAYLTGAGGAGDTIKAQKVVGTTVTDISDAIDCNKADKSIVRAGTIDDAQNELDGSSSHVLRITQASDALAKVLVTCIRIS